MKPRVGRCRSCNARVVWVRMTKSGKANPLDFDPVDRDELPEVDGVRQLPQGVVTYDREGAAEVLAKGTPLADVAHLPLHVSHFATCPQRQKHRRAA